jgi:RNA-directed DNA polymerase
MREEPRGGVVRSSEVANPETGMRNRTSTKPYVIAKRAVWEAYQQVKANRGAAGIDDETIAMFEQNLSKNLYKLWNRMSSGSYFPPPVKQVEIPKAKGGTRKLGIPTVSDRIAQTVVKQIIEPTLDPMFHPDSYGYRPGRSAKQAIAVTRKRCWEYDWVVEFDIKAAFDQIDHALLMKAVRSHIKEDWILLYIERWLKAPFETAEGTQVPRERGTPQGGVVSPILMNLFMHYVFDVWMKRNYPSCPFARYADDAVIHCSREEQAEHLMQAIAARLAECGLTMHPEKSRIVYCQDSNRTEVFPHVQFTFLGFTFRPRKAMSKQHRVFTGFLPGVSADAVKRMRKVLLSRIAAHPVNRIAELLPHNWKPLRLARLRLSLLSCHPARHQSKAVYQTLTDIAVALLENECLSLCADSIERQFGKGFVQVVFDVVVKS